MDMRTEQTGAGLAFLQGAFVGAAVALLFAPRSGRELREQLRDYGKQAGKRIGDAAEQGRQAASEALEAGRSAMDRERHRQLRQEQA
jgi:gas vesicle protein